MGFICLLCYVMLCCVVLCCVVLCCVVLCSGAEIDALLECCAPFLNLFRS